MASLFIQTDFDKEPRMFHTNIVQLVRKDMEINFKDFPEFKEFERFGIVNVKLSNQEMKAWFESLPADVSESYIVVWDNGWVSIPGKRVVSLALQP